MIYLPVMMVIGTRAIFASSTVALSAVSTGLLPSAAISIGGGSSSPSSIPPLCPDAVSEVHVRTIDAFPHRCSAETCAANSSSLRATSKLHVSSRNVRDYRALDITSLVYALCCQFFGPAPSSDTHLRLSAWPPTPRHPHHACPLHLPSQKIK